jgi:hypothetical protein
MIHFTYSYAYEPPAPMVEITLRTISDGRSTGVIPAFVDSGADGTIIPAVHLMHLQAPPMAEATIRSQWGERRRVLLYLIDIQIGSIMIRGVEVVGDEELDEIIVGRDVLNQLRVLLDGLGEVVEVSQ